MKRSPLGFLLCLLGLLVTIGTAGCGGTETGNPGGGAGRTDDNPAVELGRAICDKLFFCFGPGASFTRKECEESLEASRTLAPAFGVDDQPPPEYAQVIDEVEQSELTADEQALEGCLAAIGFLECEDSAVQAVDPEAGFADVEGMIPEEFCSEVF
jgi:hypothetical protein